MSKLGETLKELGGIDFVLTRLNRFRKADPDDIDILIEPESFSKAIAALEEEGYEAFSHDQALGGRIKGAQTNLVRPGRLKIDLHKDFTWKKSRYFDLALVWNNLEEKEIDGVKVKTPAADVDAFIVAVNIIFEKTYLTKEDWQYLRRNFKGPVFKEQAKKYGWEGAYRRFIKWWESKGSKLQGFPAFLPLTLVLYSYLEKFDLVSFLYYFFFRVRYLLNKTLPYE